MAVARASWMLDPFTVFIFLTAIVAATPIAAFVGRRLEQRGGRLWAVARVASYVGAFGLFAVCLLALSGGGYNPFIYFRF
jgi:hypothetical protein